MWILSYVANKASYYVERMKETLERRIFLNCLKRNAIWRAGRYYKNEKWKSLAIMWLQHKGKVSWILYINFPLSWEKLLVSRKSPGRFHYSHHIRKCIKIWFKGRKVLHWCLLLFVGFNLSFHELLLDSWDLGILSDFLKTLSGKNGHSALRNLLEDCLFGATRKSNFKLYSVNLKCLPSIVWRISCRYNMFWHSIE